MIQIDEEGTSYSKPVLEHLDREKIEIHGTRGHPALLLPLLFFSFAVPST